MMVTWLAGGAFTQLLHKVEDGAATLVFDGSRYWWSACSRLCFPLPPGFGHGHIPLCHQCFPEQSTQEELDHVPHIWHLCRRP
ncbi:hypothetical protein JOF56_002978 [Kibdelosporangium banguiense]|uniref:Secreted protein n=1 Tax=Kibdelosporangium banguiense TaxID=1365924 RepID=A0ABS4TDU9_9PSEU|nr:hypothetical protein [Kibdelosporangium banguiense]